MKKVISVILALCFLPICAFAETGNTYDVEKTTNLVSFEDFVYYFNFFGALLGDGHELSIENISDFAEIGDEILFKTIFNECEILTLMLSADVAEVKSIHCTWASNMKGASDYLADFLQMLMETLLACGMEMDSVLSLFTDLGENTFNVGDEGEMTIDGVKVSYAVTSYSGVTFKIERE